VNEGTLAIFVVLAVIGAAAWAAWHRDIAYPVQAPRQVLAAPTRSGRRVGAVARRRARRVSLPPKRAEAVSTPVSGSRVPHVDPETVAFQLFAKLVRAGAITETALLEHAFGVKAGSSKAYKAAHAKLKAALAELTEGQS